MSAVVYAEAAAAAPRARVRLLAGYLLDPASAAASGTSGGADRSPRLPLYNNGFHAGTTPQQQKKKKKKTVGGGGTAKYAAAAMTTAVALDASTSRLKTCHQINTLFRSQPSFAHAEALAAEFYALAASEPPQPSAGGAPSPPLPPPLPPPPPPPPPLLPLLEAVLDTLEDAGELAHVPCEVLANMSLHAPFRQAMVVGEAAEMVLALLRATRVQGAVQRGQRHAQEQIILDHGGGNDETTMMTKAKAKAVTRTDGSDMDADGPTPKLLLACVAADLLVDLVETHGDAAWFPSSLKERIVAQLNK